MLVAQTFFMLIADQMMSSSLGSWFVFPATFSHVMNFSTEPQLCTKLLDTECCDQRAHQEEVRPRPFHARTSRGESGVAFFLFWKFG